MMRFRLAYDCCGRPIWVVGTVLFGWRGCCTCMEGRNSAPFVELSENIIPAISHPAQTKDHELLLAAAARLPNLKPRCSIPLERLARGADALRRARTALNKETPNPKRYPERSEKVAKDNNCHRDYVPTHSKV